MKQQETILTNRIDVKGGALTFGQRIELGRIFQSEAGEAAKFEQVFECLHGYTPAVDDYKALLPYFKDIAEGIRYWIEQETNLLRYEPTADELSAGVRELSKKIGEFGTVKALARNYSKDPDEILAWEYAKVFGILYTDLEESRYQQRYNKIINKKSIKK